MEKKIKTKNSICFNALEIKEPFFTKGDTLVITQPFIFE